MVYDIYIYTYIHCLICFITNEIGPATVGPPRFKPTTPKNITWSWLQIQNIHEDTWFMAGIPVVMGYEGPHLDYQKLQRPEKQLFLTACAIQSLRDIHH